MKVLFLDFDGVLYSLRSATAFGGSLWTMKKENLKFFDPVGITLVRKLCQETGCQLILSSMWRIRYTCKELSDALNLEIIDSTPILHMSSYRGSEIDAWIKKHKPEKYAIVDDDNNMLEYQKPYFVETNSKEGLSFDNYKELLNLLK